MNLSLYFPLLVWATPADVNGVSSCESRTVYSPKYRNCFTHSCHFTHICCCHVWMNILYFLSAGRIMFKQWYTWDVHYIYFYLLCNSTLYNSCFILNILLACTFCSDASSYTCTLTGLNSHEDNRVISGMNLAHYLNDFCFTVFIKILQSDYAKRLFWFSRIIILLRFSSCTWNSGSISGCVCDSQVFLFSLCSSSNDSSLI